MNPAQSKDPFEAAAAAAGQPETPPDSPLADDDHEPVLETAAALDDDDDTAADAAPVGLDSSVPASGSAEAGPSANPGLAAGGKEEEEEEEEHMDVELSKLPSGDPDKTAKMQAILSQFSEEQMNRYESFRRSGFQKSNMKRLLTSITGSQKISMPMTIVVSGIAKMLVGDLVEMARVVMTERKDTGPIRPCHIREAYRRLKLDGKVPRRSVPRLFH